MSKPNRIFFTGVPGSRWSMIAQILETIPGFDTTDRTDNRRYIHSGFTGHQGAYFGRMMEFEAKLDDDYINQAWTGTGTKIVKSHDWAYSLDRIKQRFPNDWIMLVYRPDQTSFDWWKQAGGWDITYPNYAAYQNDVIMQREISWQNQSILKFAEQQNLKWSTFDSAWIKYNFNYEIDVKSIWDDIKVTILTC